MLSNRAVHIFNEDATIHLRKISQPRQKQLTLDKFLAKKARKATAEEEESTASKKNQLQRKKNQLQRKKNQLRARDREGENAKKENYPVVSWTVTPIKAVTHPPSLLLLPSMYADTTQPKRYVSK